MCRKSTRRLQNIHDEKTFVDEWRKLKSKSTILEINILNQHEGFYYNSPDQNNVAK